MGWRDHWTPPKPISTINIHGYPVGLDSKWRISDFSQCWFPSLIHLNCTRKLWCNYKYYKQLFLIFEAMKHSKDPRPTSLTFPWNLPVCLGCLGWRWHFCSSTAGSRAGGEIAWGDIGDEKLSNYMGIITNHEIRIPQNGTIMESQQVFFVVDISSSFGFLNWMMKE